MDLIFENGKKSIALLIDPDKSAGLTLDHLIEQANEHSIDLILVGGSIITIGNIHHTIQRIKELTEIPVYLFPGNASQFSPFADGILFLSLLSGRNSEFLIGNHILAAQAIKKSGIDCVPTGYLLIDGGNITSVQYISNTNPIPHNKTDIAVSTAVAGELLGMKLIYMDAGSGAQIPISSQMIEQVKSNLNIPLIVGGGIRNASQAISAFRSGADCVVVGNILESKPEVLKEISDSRFNFNQILS